MSKTNHNIPKHAALYERLSREDGLEGQSNSIKNQDGICQGVSLQNNTSS